jgi:HEAT repeat protein
MAGHQLDLFAGAGYPAAPASPGREVEPDAAVLTDTALVDALFSATLATAPGLAAEAARRRLTAAVPALERLCRRLVGYGADRMVPEQRAALLALAEIGGGDARQTVTSLILMRIVQGPTLALALSIAARLHAALPSTCLAVLLRNPDPSVRAGACCCAHSSAPVVVEALLQLLDDLHAPIANAAACALGRIGRAEARPALVRLLRAAPSAEIIDAVVPIADPDAIVILRRIARTMPDLTAAALAALDEIEA